MATTTSGGGWPHVLEGIAGDAPKKVQHTKPRGKGRVPQKPAADCKTPSCRHCGATHDSTKCCFQSAECYYCHRRDHIPAICRQRLKQTIPVSGKGKQPTHSVGAEGEALAEEEPLTPSEYKAPMKNL